MMMRDACVLCASVWLKAHTCVFHTKISFVLKVSYIYRERGGSSIRRRQIGTFKISIQSIHGTSQEPGEVLLHAVTSEKRDILDLCVFTYSEEESFSSTKTKYKDISKISS